MDDHEKIVETEAGIYIYTLSATTEKYLSRTVRKAFDSVDRVSLFLTLANPDCLARF